MSADKEVRPLRRTLYAQGLALNSFDSFMQTKEASFARRDLLLKIQAAAQQSWEEQNIFYAEPAAEGQHADRSVLATASCMH